MSLRNLFRCLHPAKIQFFFVSLGLCLSACTATVVSPGEAPDPLDAGVHDPSDGGHSHHDAGHQHDAGHSHDAGPPENITGSGRIDYTLGTHLAFPLYQTGRGGEISAHGTRILCNVSHFSYDDPIVFPGGPGEAHLHMFWGNTGTNAHSTPESLTEGNGTCHGGTTNRSAYWSPALLNAQGEVVLPLEIFTYYKSWVHDRSKIQPIPNGLEMLARSDVGGYSGQIEAGNYKGGVQLALDFPNCVAVDSSGKPILRSADNVSHLYYSTSGCPSSHPYTIPTLTFKIRYDGVGFDDAWQLSSDNSPADRGSSMHADYIASWDRTAMERLTECVIHHYSSCGLSGSGDVYWERNDTVSGETVYEWDRNLIDGVDRTPFGVMPKVLRGHGSHH